MAGHKEMLALVRDVLLRDWDPIGISDVPEAQDEYDSYVPGVYGLLMRNASIEDIVQHLARIERERMELDPRDDRLTLVAEKLRSINVKT